MPVGRCGSDQKLWREACGGSLLWDEVVEVRRGVGVVGWEVGERWAE